MQSFLPKYTGRYQLAASDRIVKIKSQIAYMKTITINLPDTVDFDDTEALMTIASRLYEKGRLSLGQAAEVVGLSKRTFMEILGNYGVSVFNYPSSDLDRDVENAKSYNL